MGVFYAGTVGRNEFFYKIRWLVKSILALKPQFHEDWCKNGHATRKKPKTGPSKNVFFSKIPQDFEPLKQVPESSHQTGYFDQNQYIGTLVLSLSAFLRIVCGLIDI